MKRSPQLLVQWEPRLPGLIAGLRPVLTPSRPRLKTECDGAAFSLRSGLLSCLFHLLVLVPFTFPTHSTVGLASKPRKVEMREITFFTPELPQVYDTSGARKGREGDSGGATAFHPRQIIRVASGDAVKDVVVNAPNLALRPEAKIANLLHISAAAPPPPVAMLAGRTAFPRIPAVAPIPPQPRVDSYEHLPAPAVQIPAVQFNVAAMPPAPVAPLRNLAAVIYPNVHATPIAPPPDAAQLASPKLPLLVAEAVQPAPSTPRNTASIPFSTLRVGVPFAVPPVPNMEISDVRRLGGSLPGVTVSPPATAANSNGIVGGTGTDPTSSPSAQYVISNRAGDKVGAPRNATGGAIAMSPQTHGARGAGGTGGGSGVGTGSGNGLAGHGDGSGAADSGAGLGLNPNAAAGSSPGPGPGGSGAKNLPRGPGITISGGTVFLPSFGAESRPSDRGAQISERPRTVPSVTVVATSRAGGALSSYGTLSGARVYTIYIQTGFGSTVVEYSEPGSVDSGFSDELIPPEPVHTEAYVAAGLQSTVVACVIDKSGFLKKLRVLRSASAESAAAILASLERWRFRPVLRGAEPVEVTALLGFQIDTR